MRAGTVRRILSIPVLLLLAQSGTAGNLFVEGSSFEAGLKGFQTAFVGLYSDREKYVAPAEIDPATAAHGRHSLKLDCRNRGRYGLQSRVYTLTPGKKYTLSLYAKADKPSFLPFQLTSTAGSHSVGINGQAALTTEWRRYSVTGILNEGTTYPTYKNRYFLSIYYYDSPQAAIWLDAIQLEEGDLTDYAPGSGAEINIVHPRAIRVFAAGRKPDPAAVRIFSVDAKRKYRLQTVLTNEYTDEAVFTRSEPVTGVDREKPAPLPALPRGLYRLESALFSGDAKLAESSFFFACVTAYDGRAEVPADRSFLGVHGDWGRLAAAWNPERDFAYAQIPPSAYYLALKDIGIHWQRTDSLSPQFVCRPEPGEIYDRHIEEMAAFAASFGVRIMPTIGHGADRGPAWTTSDRKSVKTGASLFNLDGYRTYLAKLVAAAPSIEYWETFNEPACYFSPEEFHELNKVSFETIKKVRPEATVIGICATSDLGGNLDGWTRRQVELGSLDYVDVVSVHEYYGHRTSAARDLISLVTMRGKPYWDTETLFPSKSLYRDLLAMDVAPRVYGFGNGWSDQPETQAIKAATVFLESFALGVQRQFIHAWLPGSIWYGPTGSLFEYDLSPRPIVPVIDAFSELVDGGTPQGVLDLGGETKCCFVEKNGRPVVFLRADTEQTIELPVPFGSVRVLDVMGNSFPARRTARGYLAVQVGNRPLYFVGGKEMTTEKLKRAFDTAAPGTPLFRTGPPRFGQRQGRPVLTVRITNDGARAGLSGSVRVEKCPAGIVPDSRLVEFADIQLRETREVFFPLKHFQPADRNVVVLCVRTGNREQTVSAELRAVRCGRTDKTPAVVIDRADEIGWRVQGTPWTGPPDCSAALSARWDEQSLYLSIRVSDDTVMMDTAIREKVAENKGYLYLADCVEFFLDMDLMGDFAARGHNEDDFQLLVSPPLPDGTAGAIALGSYTGRWNWAEQKDQRPESVITVASRLIGSGYAIEMAVPWRFLGGFVPRPGAMIGFSFAVDDDDTFGVSPEAGTDRLSAGRDIQMKWSSAVGDDSPAGYGILLLE